MRSTEPFSTDVDTALLRFSEETVLYCQGISNADGHEYAMNYARMLRSRAKGVGLERTRFSADVFVPNRSVIEEALNKMYRKYFATYRVASKLP
jgi:hypothetical protein